MDFEHEITRDGQPVILEIEVTHFGSAPSFWDPGEGPEWHVASWHFDVEGSETHTDNIPDLTEKEEEAIYKHAYDVIETWLSDY